MSDLTEQLIARAEKAADFIWWRGRVDVAYVIDDLVDHIKKLAQQLNEYKDAECRAVKRHGEALRERDEAYAALRCAFKTLDYKVFLQDYPDHRSVIERAQGEV